MLRVRALDSKAPILEIGFIIIYIGVVPGVFKIGRFKQIIFTQFLVLAF